jgi:uncharacterized damage-inducible protein DinB
LVVSPYISSVRFRTPTDIEPTSDERELLLRYLQLQRDMVVSATVGLSEEQARWRPGGEHLISVIGIVNHLTCVESRWIDGSYAREPSVQRTEAEFTVGEERTLADVVDAYAERAEKTDRVVRAAAAVDAQCMYPEGADLRFVLLHLIEETAHHAGHADSTRELLDGHTSDW